MTRAKDIKKGFKTLWWEAIEDADTHLNVETGQQETTIMVQYKDGGRSKRIFDDPEMFVGTGFPS